MSRNLCKTDCDRCGNDVVLDEDPRPITEAEAGCYFPEYEGMLVANATCPVCRARYLAWVDDRRRVRQPRVPDRWAGTALGSQLVAPRFDGRTHFDLSYRSSFNDEPDAVDLPTWIGAADVAERALRALLRLAKWADVIEGDADGKAAVEDARSILRQLGRWP